MIAKVRYPYTHHLTFYTYGWVRISASDTQTIYEDEMFFFLLQILWKISAEQKKAKTESVNHPVLVNAKCIRHLWPCSKLRATATTTAHRRCIWAGYLYKCDSMRNVRLRALCCVSVLRHNDRMLRSCVIVCSLSTYSALAMRLTSTARAIPGHTFTTLHSVRIRMGSLKSTCVLRIYVAPVAVWCCCRCAERGDRRFACTVPLRLMVLALLLMMVGIGTSVDTQRTQHTSQVEGTKHKGSVRRVSFES